MSRFTPIHIEMFMGGATSSSLTSGRSGISEPSWPSATGNSPLGAITLAGFRIVEVRMVEETIFMEPE